MEIEKKSLWVIDDKKLTEKENKVIQYLAVAWNAFLELPEQHPDDIQEFRYAIHSAQRIIAIRGVRMDYGIPTVACTCYLPPTDSYAWEPDSGVGQIATIGSDGWMGVSYPSSHTVKTP